MESKKSEIVDLEHRRTEMFLIGVVLVLSCIFVALEWDTSLSDRTKEKSVDDIIEDIDFEKLKKDNDMVAAISNSEENTQEVTNVKPVETVVQQEQVAEPTTSKLVVSDGKSEMPKAKVEEVMPPVIETKPEMPEGFHVVEQLPEFPGGATAFMKWITANLKYPLGAQNSKISGRVVVSFIVDKDGNTKKLKIEKSTNRTLGAEIMRIMAKMPKWKPGMQKGKPCDAMIAVPINFEI